jgi:hypothetical protein
MEQMKKQSRNASTGERGYHLNSVEIAYHAYDH